MNPFFRFPIYAGDQLIVTTQIISLGKTILSMKGKDLDKSGKTIASSTTNMLILK